MASIKLQGDTSGELTISAPAVAGTNTITLPASTGTIVTDTGAQTIEFSAGSVGTPSVTTTGDTNTGMFFPAADTIAFAKGGAEAMRIDSSGAVTMPAQPAFSVYNSTAQNNIGTDWTTINMDTEIFDQNADFNTGTYTFTAPVTGKYLLTTQVCTKDIDNATAWFMVAIQTSNRGYNASRTTGHWSADSNGFNKGIPMTAVADMDANDTAYVRFYRYIGAATTDIIASSEYSFFQGYLLG